MWNAWAPSIYPYFSTSDFPILYDKLYHFSDTSHDHDHYEFAVTDGKTCVECGERIARGTLVSVGLRVLWIEEEQFEAANGHNRDVIHVQCDAVYHDGRATPKPSYEERVRRICAGQQQRTFAAMRSYRGYDTMSREEQLRIYLIVMGGGGGGDNDDNVADPGDEALGAVRKAFSGLHAVRCGDISRWPSAVTLIESNGGFVHDQWNTQVRVCLLGADGTTEYGQPTGSKSKKYKDVKSKNSVIVVNQDWVHQFLQAFKDGTVQETAMEYLKRTWRQKKAVVGGASEAKFSNKPRPTAEQAAAIIGASSSSASASASSSTAEESSYAQASRKRSREEFERADAPEAEPTASAASAASGPAAPDALEKGIVYLPPPLKLLTQKQLDSLADWPRGKLQALAKKYGIKQTLATEQLVKEVKEAAEKERLERS